MTTEIMPTRPPNYDADSNLSVVHSESGGEEEHGKKSVLKKVKDKARKIKHTLAKKAHGNGDPEQQDDAPGPEVEGYEEDEDEEEPEAHGAPMYESEVVRREVSGGEEHGLKDIEKETFAEILKEQPRFEEDPHAPKDHDQPRSPPNYQAKVADPTASGGNECGDPLQDLDGSLRRMNILDESSPPAGSHDQFRTDPDPPSSQNAPPNPQNPDSPTRPCQPQPPGSTYAEKISSASSALAQKAAATKDVIASKLRPDRSAGETYSRGLSEKLAPLYGRVAEAGGAVVSKISPRGGGGRKSSEAESPESKVKVEETEAGVKRSEAGVSVKEYVAEKLRPGDEHKALSEMICDAIQRRREEPERQGAPDSGGKGLVETLRGTVASALGLGGESRASSEPKLEARGGEDIVSKEREGEAAGEEPKLQAAMT